VESLLSGRACGASLPNGPPSACAPLRPRGSGRGPRAPGGAQGSPGVPEEPWEPWELCLRWCGARAGLWRS